MLQNITRETGYVERNTETRSCNHHSSGKAISVTYCGCVSVALGIQHTKRLRPVVFPLWPLELWGHAVGQLVGALCHNPEGRGFDSRWCHWNISLTYTFRVQYRPVVDSASNRNEYQEYLLARGGG